MGLDDYNPSSDEDHDDEDGSYHPHGDDSDEDDSDDEYPVHDEDTIPGDSDEDDGVVRNSNDGRSRSDEDDAPALSTEVERDIDSIARRGQLGGRRTCNHRSGFRGRRENHKSGCHQKRGNQRSGRRGRRREHSRREKSLDEKMEAKYGARALKYHHRP
jgi:hypothetical protein